MIDDRMDALIRRLDRPSAPSAAFTEPTFDSLLPRVHRARRADSRWFSGIARAMRAPFGSSTVVMPAGIRLIAVLLVLALVVLSAILVVALVGSRQSRPSLGNGPLIFATPDGLRRIVPGDGSPSSVVVGGLTKGGEPLARRRSHRVLDDHAVR